MDRPPTYAPADCIAALAANRVVLASMLETVDPRIVQWRPTPAEWSILEIVNHLADKDQHDFRARIEYILSGATGEWPHINPEAWVVTHDYAARDYHESVSDALRVRDTSLDWLRSLHAPAWERTYAHPRGPLSAQTMLANWVAHDYLHMRQLSRRFHAALRRAVGDPLPYAGRW